jgi:hypothetical protein
MSKFLLLLLSSISFITFGENTRVEVHPENTGSLNFSYCEHSNGGATIKYPTVVDKNWSAIATIVSYSTNDNKIFTAKSELGKLDNTQNRFDLMFNTGQQTGMDMSLTITYKCESNCEGVNMKYYHLSSIKSFAGTGVKMCL